MPQLAVRSVPKVLTPAITPHVTRIVFAVIQVALLAGMNVSKAAGLLVHPANPAAAIE